MSGAYMNQYGPSSKVNAAVPGTVHFVTTCARALFPGAAETVVNTVAMTAVTIVVSLLNNIVVSLVIYPRGKNVDRPIKRSKRVCGLV
jgi:hypothetical protein